MAALQPWSLTMQTVLALVLVAFGARSTDAMMQGGYLGVLQAGTANAGAWRVLMDAFAMITLSAGSCESLRHLLLARIASAEQLACNGSASW